MVFTREQVDQFKATAEKAGFEVGETGTTLILFPSRNRGHHFRCDAFLSLTGPRAGSLEIDTIAWVFPGDEPKGEHEDRLKGEMLRNLTAARNLKDTAKEFEELLSAVPELFQLLVVANNIGNAYASLHRL